MTLVSTPPATSESEHHRRLCRLLGELTEVIFANADDFGAVCTHACRIAVETGGYRFAFVGMLHPHSPYITPVYQFGDHNGYLSGLRLSIDPEHPEGRGPTGTAARTLRSYCVNDIMTDPVMERWRAEAQRVGVRASAAFPLFDGAGGAFGVLNLYSGVPYRFDADEVSLLSRVAQMISIAYGRHREEEKRRIADEERRQAQIRLANILDMAGDAIITVNEAKEIQLFNKAAEEIFGWNAEEVIGRPLEILIPPHLIEKHDEHMRNFTALPNAGPHRVRRREVQAVRKDGSLFPAANSFSRVRDNGKWTYIATLRDITVTKAHEASLMQVHKTLERAAHEWRVTFDAVSSPVIICGRDKRIRRLNKAACKFLERNAADAIDMLLSEGMPEGMAHELEPEIDAVIESGGTKQITVACPANGRYWHFTVSPWGIDLGGEPAAVLVADDVTELLRLQESVRESETMAELGQLVAGVSHEVRNPLFGMSATLDAFELRYGSNPDFSRYIEAFRRELNRMSELIRDLLNYGKPLDLKLEASPVGELIQQAADACALILQEKGLKLQIELPERTPLIEVDKKNMLHVARNLIENAAQHAPAGSTVEVRVFESFDGATGWLWCAVRDHGSGFQKEDLPRVFQPFFSRRKGGTGLGLSIVERIIEKHGGVVKAANHPEGGAEVTIGLPLP